MAKQEKVVPPAPGAGESKKLSPEQLRKALLQDCQSIGVLVGMVMRTPTLQNVIIEEMIRIQHEYDRAKANDRSSPPNLA